MGIASLWTFVVPKTTMDSCVVSELCLPISDIFCFRPSMDFLFLSNLVQRNFEEWFDLV